MFTIAMSEDALIRLENLKRMNKTPKELEMAVGGRYTYWHDMLAGTKSFGEKAARKIEEKLGLYRGQLDQENSISAATLTAPTGTLSAAGSASKQWPATVNTAQCATDTIAIVDTLLDKMAATDQTDRAMIGATLAALAANPHDAKKRDLLLQMLDSSAFAEVRQKVA